MKADLVDVNETRKSLKIEIPSDVVDAEIDRVARDYSRKARIPGFRPGKAPTRVIKQRFKDQILHDVAHDLVPRAVDEALRERGVEPVDTPDILDTVDTLAADDSTDQLDASHTSGPGRRQLRSGHRTTRRQPFHRSDALRQPRLHQGGAGGGQSNPGHQPDTRRADDHSRRLFNGHLAGSHGGDRRR